MSNDHNNRSFVQELRKALRNLYDSFELRKSPLITLFNVDQAENPSLTLRNILIDGIEVLKPKANISSQTKVWRCYQILFHRFIEQFTQKEGATDLNLSVRHLRREESSAVQTLADYFWAYYNLETKLKNYSGASPNAIGKPLILNNVIAPTREEELKWLQESLPAESVDIGEVIRAVLGIIEPLSRSINVLIDCKISENLPRLTVQLTAIRQALVNILTMAIRCVPNGRVFIEAKLIRWDLNILFQARGNRIVPSLNKDDIELLKITKQLVGLSGGVLEVSAHEDNAQLIFQLIVPGKEQIPVLVIDDNPDTLRLFERYLSNTRYRFIGTSEPEKALGLVERMGIQFIILDIMLPGSDGWEFLGRLRVHPSTHHVPIIVCTILPQEPLAVALGAAAFMRKPVTRQALLAELNQQIALIQKESH